MSTLALLRDVLEMMETEANNADGRDRIGLLCTRCEMGWGADHSVGCRVRAAIREEEEAAARCHRCEERPMHPDCGVYCSRCSEREAEAFAQVLGQMIERVK